MRTRLVAIAQHHNKYKKPICFQAGDKLIRGREDDEYPGWIWVTTHDGNQGWAPLQYIEMTGPDSARAVHDYSAQELDVSIGDKLNLVYELNNWGWVSNEQGNVGWVPLNVTRALAG